MKYTVERLIIAEFFQKITDICKNLQIKNNHNIFTHSKWFFKTLTAVFNATVNTWLYIWTLD